MKIESRKIVITRGRRGEGFCIQKGPFFEWVEKDEVFERIPCIKNEVLEKLRVPIVSEESVDKLENGVIDSIKITVEVEEE